MRWICVALKRFARDLKSFEELMAEVAPRDLT